MEQCIGVYLRAGFCFFSFFGSISSFRHNYSRSFVYVAHRGSDVPLIILAMKRIDVYNHVVLPTYCKGIEGATLAECGKPDGIPKLPVRNLSILFEQSNWCWEKRKYEPEHILPWWTGTTRDRVRVSRLSSSDSLQILSMALPLRRERDKVVDAPL